MLAPAGIADQPVLGMLSRIVVGKHPVLSSHDDFSLAAGLRQNQHGAKGMIAVFFGGG